MAQINANKLIDFIKLYFPEDATEISDALELLSGLSTLFKTLFCRTLTSYILQG